MAYAPPASAETAVSTGPRQQASRKDDDRRAEARGGAKRARADRRVVYAAGEIPDDLVAAIRAAEPPAETAQYDWELTAEDGADT